MLPHMSYACGINILVLAMGAHANSLGLFDLNNRKYNFRTLLK